jgi:hypothetical protein
MPREYGGVAIIWRENIDHFLELVGICAISVAAGGMSRLKKDSWH